MESRLTAEKDNLGTKIDADERRLRKSIRAKRDLLTTEIESRESIHASELEHKLTELNARFGAQIEAHARVKTFSDPDSEYGAVIKEGAAVNAAVSQAFASGDPMHIMRAQRAQDRFFSVNEDTYLALENALPVIAAGGSDYNSYLRSVTVK